VNLDIASRFEKQAAWQRSRAAGPWADKLRTSVAMRSALKIMKKEHWRPITGRPESQHRIWNSGQEFPHPFLIS
jgi:hypothetical protein